MTPTPSASQTASADAGEGWVEAAARVIHGNEFPGQPWEEATKAYREHCRDTARKIAALRQTSSEPVAWIVGNGSDTRWRAWDQGNPVWVDDRQKATRYSRREDAEAVHAEDEDAWTVKPFTDAAPAAPEHAASERVRDHIADAGKMVASPQPVVGDREMFGLLRELIQEQSEGEWDDDMIDRDARKFTDAILASLASRPEGDWRPIETAPKNEEGYLWSPEYPDRTDAFGFVAERADGTAFTSSEWRGVKFTHWHPRIEPPACPPPPSGEGG